MPEVYRIYDESRERPHVVRDAHRSTVVPSMDTGEKLRGLAQVVLAHQRGEASDQQLVEAVVQVDPALTKRLKKTRAWKGGNWPVIAALLLTALTAIPDQVAAEVPADPATVTIPIEDFLKLVDRAAAAADVSAGPAGTDPEAPSPGRRSPEATP